MIITILFAIVFIALLAKAIIETIHGLGLAVYALFMLIVVAPALDLAAFIVRMFSKPEAKTKVCRKPSGHIPGAIHFW